jgi:hypothetical protein
MLNIIKKIVAFITISSIWLLPVILPEVQAQQTATPPSTAATSPAIIIEELKASKQPKSYRPQPAGSKKFKQSWKHYPALLRQIYLIIPRC